MIDTLETVRNLEAAGFDPTVAKAIARAHYNASISSLMDFNPIETAEALEASGLPHAQAMAIADVLLTVVKVRESERTIATPRRVSKCSLWGRH